MPVVPQAAGPQVRPDVTPLPGRRAVSAPNIVTGDFSLRNPANLVSPTFSLEKKQAFSSGYNQYKSNPTQYADTGAEGLMAFGRGLSHAGDAIGAIGQDVATQANAIMADNAVNQAKELALRLAYDKQNGFTSLKGFDALNRPDGKPLADEYATKFDDGVKAIGEGLKNPDQKAAFAAQALGIRTSLYGQATQHETQEFRTYNLSTQEGTIKVETDNMALNYKNPDQLNTSVERIKGAVAEQGMALGKSHTWIEAAQQDAVSKAHSMALVSALEDGNIVFADAYMKMHAKEMNADDVLRTRGVITKEMDGRMAIAAAKDAVAVIAPDFEPTDRDRLHRVVLGLEGGGTIENPKTSPKGARGPQQVMPHTADKPGYGIKPSDGTPKDDARLGGEYLDAMIKLRNGDVALAMASYNAGPGRVDAALKEARATGKSWLSLVPKETRDYVTNGLATYGAGGGAPAPPSLESALAALDRDPRVNQSPARLNAAQAEVKQRYSAMVSDKKTREDDTLATALRAVEQNGGNYMALPVSLRSAIPADKLDTVMNFADKVRGGNTVTNLAVYQRLTDDKYLKGLSDGAFYNLRPELSPSDFQHFADARAKPASGQGPGDLNTPAITATLTNRLQALGVDPTPKDKDKVGMARVGAINRFVREQVIVAQQQRGKKFDDAETTAFIDGLFNKSVTFRDTILGVTTGESSHRLLGLTLKDIPEDSIKGVRDAFKKRGISDPSDSDVLAAYWRTKALAGR